MMKKRCLLKNAKAILQNKRFYKIKNPAKSFLCALCRSPRQMKYKKSLSMKNFGQILVMSIFCMWAFYPLMHEKAILLLFLIWPIVEGTNKILYRKEIPCPYCGFDATWYRRDVRVAKKLVEEFWQKDQKVRDDFSEHASSPE